MKKSRFALILSLVFAFSVSSVHAQTDDSALIAQLQAQIAQLQEQITAMVGAQTGTATLSLTQNLSVGSTDATTGGEVTMLQTFLKNNGHYAYPSITGYFGGVTEAAVKSYQAQNGLPAIGIVGPETWTKMRGQAAPAFVRVMPTDQGIDDVDEDKRKDEVLREEAAGMHRVLLPAGGEMWKKRAIKTIHWTYDIEDRKQEVDIMIDELDPRCADDFDADAEICEPVRTYDITFRSSNDGSQTWDVGEAHDNISRTAPTIGHFLMRIKNRETGEELVSASPFEIVDHSEDVNEHPDIISFRGPERVSIGESNTWTIRASDDESEELLYTIFWGGNIASDESKQTDESEAKVLFDHVYERDDVGEVIIIASVADEDGARDFYKKILTVSQY